MPDPATDIRTLSSAHPIALLPVRIETRFVASPPELWIRVYPDEIAAETSRLLTTDAVEAGRQYWRQAWQPANELDAWRRLVLQYPPHVAAGLVREQTPQNIATRPAGEPTWGPPPSGSPTHTATTRVLPDGWMAIAYRNDVEVGRFTGRDIVEPLALSFRRDLAEGAPELVDHDGLQVEPDLLWTVDFDRAVEIGMGLRMPISDFDYINGFDRLIVIGVKTTITPAEGGVRMRDLLDGHHYNRGLAIVPQGTPTNNSNEGASGYPPPTTAERSFAIERAGRLIAEGSDGELLEKAFGLPVPTVPPLDRVFDHVEGADRIEQQRARAMNRALWPCTLGYFLEQMMSPLLTAVDIAEIRDHFVEHVRGRGPVPTFRVGRVPYGVLPVTPLGPGGPEELFDSRLGTLLQVWSGLCRNLANGVARIGKTPDDPDADLLGVLALDASCREVRLRETIGPAYVAAALQLLGHPPTYGDTDRAALANTVLNAAGIQGTPRIGRMTFANDALRVRRPMVTDEPPSEEQPLSENYIETLRATSIAALRSAGQPGTPEFDLPLLYHVLRQAALVEYGRVAVDLAILDADTDTTELDRREVEFFQIVPSTVRRRTPWERFEAPLPRTGSTPLGEWLLDLPGDPAQDEGREPIREYLGALGELETVPTAELERLLTETLDTCSHRLDAWMTSLATRRLAQMRSSQPTGVPRGGFAFVENLRHRNGQRPSAFVHAPSATHAAAAAVLRNAYVTRVGAEEVAIDLSSRRVRRALALLDGVRQGQPAGAVLGYWFERALHDRQLDTYIDPFRRKYPLGKLPGPQTEAPSERIAARNVVNGLALRDALFGRSEIPWDVIAIMPPVAGPDRPGVQACLEQLEDDVDAAADLFAAESVYQVIQGNVDRAAANLATVSGSGNVPTPGIVTAPTAGTAITHRVAIMLGAPPVPEFWTSTTPRRVAEPRLDSWLALLLGDPADIRCRASYDDPSDPSQRVEVTVSMQDLGLGALDFIVVARRSSSEGGGELAARAIARVRSTVVGITSAIDVDFGRPTAPPLWPTTVFSFAEALEMARLVGDLVTGARPLVADDLVPPSEAGDPAEPDTADMDARASAASTRFADARGGLDAAVTAAESPTPPPTSIDDLRAALWVVTGFGVHDAVPVDLAGTDEVARAALLAQARSVQAELARRGDAADAPQTTGFDKLTAWFGPELPILTPFTPTNRADIDAALDNPPASELDARIWLQMMARVREPLSRLRLAHLATATGAATSATIFVFQIAQLPYRAGAPWIGKPFDPNDPTQRPRAGTAGIVLDRPSFDTTGSWAGLLIDEWAETIPAATQMTAYAVQHDAPGAEAPQCVVLAVPAPWAGTTWDLPALEACVNQTLDLAKIRAVDSDRLGAYSLLAPCIYLAANVADDTITSPLAAMQIGETVVMPPE